MVMQHTLIQPAKAVLEQGLALLEQLTESQYSCKVPLVFNASIGAHYRHCLDHFKTLREQAHTGVINYDIRQRGTSVEYDRMAAFGLTQSLMESLDTLPLLTEKIRVCGKSSYEEAGTEEAFSTVGRELLYAVSHAIHHYALIKVIAGMQGVQLPAHFGIAPSTAHHQEKAMRALALSA